MANYSLVLDDRLLRMLHDFRHGKAPSDFKILLRLLTMYRPPHLTNVSQLQRSGVDDDVLLSDLAANNLIGQDLEELAAMTDYRIILSHDSDECPYVKVDGGLFDNDYVLTCTIGAPRDKAHSHLKELFSCASSIVIHDKYLGVSWSSARALFDLLPAGRIGVFFTKKTNVSQARRSELKRDHPLWNIREDSRSSYADHHDRYILVDDRMEIVITSGIDYLFDVTKECTLIFRVKDR
ncbi:MAG: hypothetical protein EOM12_14150 [Verrucomicrobiae bacterium]|nr:hypothetical protein [Verrucomicrobiae bacterium]